MDDLSLTAREGLPDALRVLLEAYPRSGWEADPGFDGLVRFWLERHLMFRRLLSQMGEETEALLDRRAEPAAWGGRFARLGGLFVQELHGHHRIEDLQYFPVLAAREPRLERGFALLDRDHEALDGILDGFVGVANGALSGLDRGRDAAAPLVPETARLARLLDRHLIDEEDLVVPVLLKHPDAA